MLRPTRIRTRKNSILGFVVSFGWLGLIGGCAPAPDVVDGGDAGAEAGRTASGETPAQPAPSPASEETPDAGPNPDSGPSTPVSAAALACVDYDGDGYGPGCAPGTDCDENDRTVTDQCYRCLRPATGCACGENGTRRACNALTDSDALTAENVCHPGERVCENGTWGRCRALDGSSRVIVPPSSCANPCNPECRQATVCPDSNTDLNAAGVITSTNVIIGSAATPGFCPMGTTFGGVRLSGGVNAMPPMTCADRCGGVCCMPGEECVDDSDYSPVDSCLDPANAPLPIIVRRCRPACAAGTTRCGSGVTATCCGGSQVCIEGRCRDYTQTCNPNSADCVANPNPDPPSGGWNRANNNCQSNCPAGQYCHIPRNRNQNVAGRPVVMTEPAVCLPIPSHANGCSVCTGMTNMQRCLERVRNPQLPTTPMNAGGQELPNSGRIIDDVFHTPEGVLAPALSFGAYHHGMEFIPTSCAWGTSPNPTNCASYTCNNRDLSAAGLANIRNAADHLNWGYVWHGRLNPSGSTATPATSLSLLGDGQNPRNGTANSVLSILNAPYWPIPGTSPQAFQNGPIDSYRPEYGIIFDLGTPANRVALFPTTDHVSDSCLEPFEYTVYLSDNPWARAVGYPDNADAPDPTRWNLAMLVRVFRRGWTNNPNHNGQPSSMQNPRTGLDSNNEATADAMATVWAMPCGYSFRFASVVAGNRGNPGAECRFHSFDAEFDAIAGLSVEGSALGIYHVLPYGGTAGPDPATFSTRVRSADVYFLMDTTGSMWEEIDELRSTITNGNFVGGSRPDCANGVAGGILCIIPDAWIGVGEFKDYPIGSFGGNTDWPFRQWLPSTDMTTAGGLVSLANSIATGQTPAHYEASGGADIPESHIPALYQLATGLALGGHSLAGGSGAIPNQCPNLPMSPWGVAPFGYPCFRDGTIPIILMFTDAAFHNGPGNSWPYNTFMDGHTPPSYTAAVNALVGIRAKVVQIVSCPGSPANCSTSGDSYAVQAWSDALALANSTNSRVGTGAGSEAVYAVATNGTGLGPQVVGAVRELAQGEAMDVTAYALDDLGTPIDERCFIESPPDPAYYGYLRLSDPQLGEGPPYPTGRCRADPLSVSGWPIGAEDCTPGTQVSFRASFRNTCVMSRNMPQTFNFFIVVMGNGVYELGRIPVQIVVPAVNYPATGTYTHTVDASAVCGPGRHVDWSAVQLVADTPMGTSIRVSGIAAPTLADLNTRSMVADSYDWNPAMSDAVFLGDVPPMTSPLDIGSRFSADGQSNRMPFFRVRFKLYANSPANDRTPILQGYRVLFNCIDGT